MNEDLAISVSISMKVNLGNYESADAFLCVSGVKPGTTPEAIKALADVEGKIAYNVLAAKLLDNVRGLKRLAHQAKALDPALVSEGERERNAKLWMKRDVSMNTDAYNDYVAIAGSEWADIALAAEQAGINTYPALIDYAKARQGSGSKAPLPRCDTQTPAEVSA